MIFGIGTDIVGYARIEKMHEHHGERAAQHILSGAELAEYAASTSQARLLMKRFAAKEALAKALGSGMRHPVSFQRISVTHDALGKPAFEFAPELAAHIEQMGVTKHHLSISDERDVAVAFVVLEKD